MLVLVTGASGFVGRELVNALLERNHRVRACTRSSPVLPDRENFEPIQIDVVRDSKAWRAALHGVELVVHLAAQVHVMGELDSQLIDSFYRVNAEGTRRVAEQAAQGGARRFVYLSTIKVYGENSGLSPFRPADEPMPADPYSKSKLKGEEYVREIAASSSMEAVIVRPPMVYGPNVRANFLRLMEWARKGIPLPVGAIDNRRSLVSVWNLCDFLMRCAERESVPAAPLLVSDGVSVSTPQLLRMIGRPMSRAVPMFAAPGPALSFAASLLGKRAELDRLTGSLELDATESFEAMGWTPPVPMDVGIERTVRWYLETAKR